MIFNVWRLISMETMYDRKLEISNTKLLELQAQQNSSMNKMKMLFSNSEKDNKKLLESDKINKSETIEKLLPMVKKNCTTKFDESIDVSLKINLKQSKGGDLNLRFENDKLFLSGEVIYL